MREGYKFLYPGGMLGEIHDEMAFLLASLFHYYFKNEINIVAMVLMEGIG